MKILFVFNHPAPYKINLLNELNKHHEIDVIFERNKNKDRHPLFYNTKLTANSISVSGISIGNENHFGLSLKRYIKSNHHKYDVIIMNGYSTFSEIIALKYMLKHNIPYYLCVNGGVVRKDSNRKFKLKQDFISGARGILSPCKEVDNYLLHYGAVKEKIFYYTYSTVFKKEILKSPLSFEQKIKLRKKLNIADGLTMVYAGQFINRKNNEQLLEYFKNFPSINLYLIGDGKNKKNYLSYIKQHDIRNVNIIDYKVKSDLFEWFRASDAFITFSKEDIYGHMINEALSQGLPVVSSDKVMAALHLIKNDINGLIVNLDDLSSLENFIKKLPSDFLSLNAITSSRHHSVENMVKDHLRILEELL